MASNKTYHVEYRMADWLEYKGLDVLAPNKAAALDRAVYTAIPAREGEEPESAYVRSVTYNNGNHRRFI